MAYEQALPAGFKLVGGLHEYTIVQVLGQGGFGITYKVKAHIKAGNIKITTHFAVKEFFPSTCWRSPGSTNMLFPPTVGADIQASLTDFIYEGKRLQAICNMNPNIVQVNEVFEANGTAYYVMEYLDGGDLRKLVKENGNSLTEQQMLSIMNPIGQAVQCLHDNNMLHLDIKPDNIVMRRDDDGGPDMPVLIDFGLATHFDQSGTPTSKTPSSGISAGYSPIEQYSMLQHFDPRLDVYAFAATCLYMLTGKDPVEAIHIPTNYVSGVLPPSVSPHIVRALVLGMSKDLASRTKTINNLLGNLTIVDDIEVIEKDPPLPPQQPLQQSPQQVDLSSKTQIDEKHVPPAYDNNNDQPQQLPEEPIQLVQPEKGKSHKTLLIAFLSILALAAIGLGIWAAVSLLGNNKHKKGGSERSDDDTEEVSLSKAMSDTIYCDALVTAAEDGDDDAQNILGECYFNGYGIDVDKEKAARWYEKAAEQGNTEAQYSIGYSYYIGEGVNQNYEKAVKWLIKAANKDHPFAQYILALCYDYGNGVSLSKETAVEWYQKSADQGYLPAINDLGACYIEGEGIKQDIPKAIELYTFAAENGYALSQKNLASCYEDGIGVTKNLDKAVELYRKAAEQGEEDAIAALERLGY